MEMDQSHGERSIVLVDMDCFYVQVEQKLCPEYQNKPAAVVQYSNGWKGGGIIAVNYEARALGVNRGMRGDEAQKHCPEIHLFRVPEVHGKADLTRYREAGALVLGVLCEFSDCVERASVDEAYLDMTSIINKQMSVATPVSASQLPNTFVVGWEDKKLSGQGNDATSDNLENWLQTIYEDDHLYNDRMLALTAVTVEEMRAAVFEKTGYRCSAGIAHNKMLAKLSCGLHKPNKQTLLPQSSVQLLYSTISVSKVRNLGGKFGEEVVEKLKAKTMSDLLNYSEAQFNLHFGEKTGSWLFKLSRGIENEPVIARQLPKSIGCGKNFPGKTALSTKDKVHQWLQQLSEELEERLLKDQVNNCRVARSLTITVRNQGANGYSIISRTCPIYAYNSEKLTNDAMSVLLKLNSASASSLEWKPPILSLALAASKFEDKIDNTSDIQSYFTSITKSSDSAMDKKLECSVSENDKTDVSMKVMNSDDLKANQSSENTRKLVHSNSPKTGIAHFFNAQKHVSESLCEKSERVLNSSVERQLDTNSNDKQFRVDLVDEIRINTKKKFISALNKNLLCVSQISEKSHGPKPKGSENTRKLVNSNSPKTGIARFFNAQKHVSESLCEKSERVLNSSVERQLDTDSNDKQFRVDLVDEIQINTKKNFTSALNKNLLCVSQISEKSHGPKPKGFFAKNLEKFPDDSNCNVENETFKDPSDSASLQINIAAVPSTSGHQFEPHDSSNLDPELTKMCNKCSKLIPIWEEAEHSDFHLALELSKEVNIPNVKQTEKIFSPGSTSQMKQTTKSKKGSIKRKSNSKSLQKVKKHSPIQTNTLDAFVK